MSDWQDIATAPKDGSAILIFQSQKPSFATAMDGQKFDDPRYAIGYWRVWEDGAKWMWGNRNCGEVSPTHWMPLPSPPMSSEAKASVKHGSD
jgi:hypothetical protein